MTKKKTKKLESKTEAEVFAFMKYWGITDYGTAKCLFEQDKRIAALESKGK
jgi:hypothetical protein